MCRAPRWRLHHVCHVRDGTAHVGKHVDGDLDRPHAIVTHHIARGNPQEWKRQRGTCADFAAWAFPFGARVDMPLALPYRTR